VTSGNNTGLKLRVSYKSLTGKGKWNEGEDSVFPIQVHSLNHYFYYGSISYYY
jgi:hypothetical protein